MKKKYEIAYTDRQIRSRALSVHGLHHGSAEERALRDVLQRLLERSDPKILVLIRTKRKLKTVTVSTVSGSPTHTIRSHNRIEEAASSGAYNTAVRHILMIEDSAH